MNYGSHPHLSEPNKRPIGSNGISCLLPQDFCLAVSNISLPIHCVGLLTVNTDDPAHDAKLEIENDALPKHKDHIQNREVWYAAVVLLGGLLFVGFVLLLF